MVQVFIDSTINTFLSELFPLLLVNFSCINTADAEQLFLVFT